MTTHTMTMLPITVEQRALARSRRSLDPSFPRRHSCRPHQPRDPRRDGPRELRVAAVDVIAGEAGTVAQVLVAREAVATLAACPAEPGDADPRSRLVAARTVEHLTDDLMPEDEWKLGVSELSVHDVEIGRASCRERVSFLV